MTTGRWLRVLRLALPLTLALTALSCADRTPPVFTEDGAKINVYLDPVQEPYSPQETLRKQIAGGRITLTPVATYRIAGEVMSKRKYTHGWGAEVAPFDLAIVWGMLTYPHVMKRLSVQHDSTRMAWFHITGDEPPVDVDYAFSHGSNNHIIPANDNIRTAIDREVRVHDRIVLDGYLVHVEGHSKDQPISMKTSLSREDSDRGACEIVYVTWMQVGRRVYR